jgi:hypothetical protein
MKGPSKTDACNSLENSLFRQINSLIRADLHRPNSLRRPHCSKIIRFLKASPRQRIEGTRNLWDIPLITGERLVFDGDGREFSVI